MPERARADLSTEGGARPGEQASPEGCLYLKERRRREIGAPFARKREHHDPKLIGASDPAPEPIGALLAYFGRASRAVGSLARKPSKRALSTLSLALVADDQTVPIAGFPVVLTPWLERGAGGRSCRRCNAQLERARAKRDETITSILRWAPTRPTFRRCEHSRRWERSRRWSASVSHATRAAMPAGEWPSADRPSPLRSARREVYRGWHVVRDNGAPPRPRRTPRAHSDTQPCE